MASFSLLPIVLRVTLPSVSFLDINTCIESTPAYLKPLSHYRGLWCFLRGSPGSLFSLYMCTMPRKWIMSSTKCRTHERSFTRNGLRGELMHRLSCPSPLRANVRLRGENRHLKSVRLCVDNRWGSVGEISSVPIICVCSLSVTLNQKWRKVYHLLLWLVTV